MEENNIDKIHHMKDQRIDYSGFKLLGFDIRRITDTFAASATPNSRSITLLLLFLKFVWLE